ncbi:kinase-like protein [Lentithecium fluviatile CBS 122367]|uniref:Kinase-like protein n=1 Tax=Lentithecium fluviatile CBS 122367 TaxID=1168545 RepID=A0A6G1JP67_9PLEO|nr:kinase-like protein [Lentithecium fluviatile CBS 122367]
MNGSRCSPAWIRIQSQPTTPFPTPLTPPPPPNQKLSRAILLTSGHGGTASVEMVRDTDSGSVYARKIFRNIYTRNVKAAEKKLLEEVQIMRRLADHHHIVRLHATYVVKRELAIILEPVANQGDLATFLQDCRDQEIWKDPRCPRVRLLNKAFGCLALGLAFMHEQTIRHKDIKPQNILIHNGAVLYTDFGLSYDFGDAGQSTTTGLVQGLTRRYCAPVVADHGRRNTTSDIFSLGCVYIEICSALHPDQVAEELLDGPFFEKLRTLPDQGLPLPGESFAMNITRAMVQHARPAALSIANDLMVFNTFHFCEQCQAHRNDLNAREAVG